MYSTENYCHSTIDFNSLWMPWNFHESVEQVLCLIAMQTHGNWSSWLEESLPWISVGTNKPTLIPHSHVNFHSIWNELNRHWNAVKKCVRACMEWLLQLPCLNYDASITMGLRGDQTQQVCSTLPGNFLCHLKWAEIDSSSQKVYAS